MEINFFEPDDVPQPKDRVKIQKLTATPYPDGWRIRIGLDVTPFQERPNLELDLTTAANQSVAQLSIIETMHPRMEFTVHIRGVNDPTGEYILRAELYYEDRTHILDRAETRFTVTN